MGEIGVIELVPLCTARVKPGPGVDLGVTPAGRRIMVPLLEAEWQGERFRASLKPGTMAGDWLVISSEGTGSIDIRLTLETDDGALIHVEYHGRRNIAAVEAGVDAPVYIAPRFETSDPRYAWLNLVQAVGKGQLDGEYRIYDIYEIR